MLEVETEAKPGHVLQMEIRRLDDGWDVGVSGERDQGCCQGSGSHSCKDGPGVPTVTEQG